VKPRMNLQNRWTVLAVVALLGVPVLAYSSSTGPQPASTGAPAGGGLPAELNCTSCHATSAVNPDDGGTLTLEGLPDAYAVGESYPLTLKIAHTDPSVMRWGFQLTSVAAEAMTGAGAFVVTDPQKTQVIEGGPGGRTYIEHGYGGTGIGTPGGFAWTFTWKAPDTDVGAVHFYGAANAANTDGSQQGDRIYSPSPEPLATIAGPGGDG